MTQMTMVEAIRDALHLEMERDDKVLVIGQDVGELGGIFRATDGLLARFGADRVVDMPLAEGGIVGAAIGLALAGLTPVAEIQFLGFSLQALHQLGPQLARFRARSLGRYPMPVTIRSPFGAGVRAPELHSDALESLFVQFPGLKVVAPSTPYDAKGLLIEAIRDPDPVLFCEPLRGYRRERADVPSESYTVPFGQIRTVTDGQDVTIVAWSGAVYIAEEAAERLASEGVSARVVDLRTLVPLDEDGLCEAVKATGRCVVVQEAPLTGGFGAEVVATIQEGALYALEAPIRRVAAPDAPFPLAALERHYVPSVGRVTRAVHEVLSE